SRARLLSKRVVEVAYTACPGRRADSASRTKVGDRISYPGRDLGHLALRYGGRPCLVRGGGPPRCEGRHARGSKASHRSRTKGAWDRRTADAAGRAAYMAADGYGSRRETRAAGAGAWCSG